MCQRRELASVAFKFSTILLVFALLVATVASVPTSVLAQNTELSANNDIESLNKLKQSSQIQNSNFLAKAKRSSDTLKANADNAAASTSAPAAASSNLEKKSSPEVVPASFNAPPPSKLSNSGSLAFALPPNSDLSNSEFAARYATAAVQAALAANQEGQAQFNDDANNADAAAAPPPTMLHKRGISLAQQQFDDAYYTNPYLSEGSSALPAEGVWADEIEPANGYAQTQDLDAPLYNARAYDNVQSVNAEPYMEPLPYASRYYGNNDRNKRADGNKFNRHNELRTKLTPADMLALVALVEAGERDRKDVAADGMMDTVDSALYNPHNYYGNNNGNGNNVGLYDYPNLAANDEEIDSDLNAVPNNFYEPNALLDFYGTPVNFETLPKYEVTTPREQKYVNRNRYGVKRFMVAKKSRPLGKFLNEPVAKPSISFVPSFDQYY